jgi:hypothetical protein
MIYHLESRSDFIILLVMSTLMVAMGILFFLFPPRLVPTDPTAYMATSGTVAAVIDPGGRRSRSVEFTLAEDARTFESRAVAYRRGADAWMPGRTRLAFYVERNGPHSGSRYNPVPAYCLVVDGQLSRSLADDIAATNSVPAPWAGLLPLFIGCSGFVAGALVWRKRKKARWGK